MECKRWRAGGRVTSSAGSRAAEQPGSRAWVPNGSSVSASKAWSEFNLVAEGILGPAGGVTKIVLFYVHRPVVPVSGGLECECEVGVVCCGESPRHTLY